MPTTDRAARRQRILEERQNRLALITGRAPNVSSPPPPPPRSLSHGAAADVAAQSPPLPSRDRVPLARISSAPAELYKQVRITCVVTRDKFKGEAAKPNQNGEFAYRSRKESFLRRHEAGSVSCLEELITNPLNFFGSIGSQQLRYVLANTAQPRMAFSITMALLVFMSHFEFPILGNKIIKSIILFKPLLFLLLSNVALIVVRLTPERREKEDHKLTISEGYVWVEEVGNAVEVILMLHDLLKPFFMDFVVYSLIVICGFGFAC